MKITTTLQPLSTLAQQRRRHRWFLGGLATFLLIVVALVAPM